MNQASVSLLSKIKSQHMTHLVSAAESIVHPPEWIPSMAMHSESISQVLYSLAGRTRLQRFSPLLLRLHARHLILWVLAQSLDWPIEQGLDVDLRYVDSCETFRHCAFFKLILFEMTRALEDMSVQGSLDHIA